MEEEILDGHLARCVILDSQVVRQRLLQFRDTERIRDRPLIRSILSGVGKNPMCRLKNNISA